MLRMRTRGRVSFVIRACRIDGPVQRIPRGDHMKRTAKKRAKPSGKAKHSSEKQALASPPPERNRRAFLRNVAIGVLAAGVVGFFSVQSVQATMAEHDLTQIGQGVPSIVQIHDPNCGLCRDLQRETRAALKSFDPEKVLYRVANIKSHDGAALANLHGVPHVTLLLFDADGALRSTLRGPTTRADLRVAFESHLNANR